MNTVTESYIRQYLVARLQVTADKEEMLNRWNAEGPVKWMSSDVVFNDFVKTTVADFDRMDREGWTRSIDILSVIKVSSNQCGFDKNNLILTIPFLLFFFFWTL